MQNVICPLCRKQVDIDHGRRAGRGQLRLTCPSCGNRFAVKIQKRELRLGGTDAPAPAASSEKSAKKKRFAVLVEHLDASGDLAGLFRVLRELPMFADDPSQISRIPQSVPFPIAGLREEDAHRIEAELKKLVAIYKVGPERQILVGPLRSLVGRE